MARLLADEQFPRKSVELLCTLRHDVITIQEAGKAGISDEMVLDFAILENRAVLTSSRDVYDALCLRTTCLILLMMK
jgi:predicted nuclease of predicted toxin-antitoxin system